MVIPIKPYTAQLGGLPDSSPKQEMQGRLCESPVHSKSLAFSAILPIAAAISRISSSSPKSAFCVIQTVSHASRCELGKTHQLRKS